MEKRKYNLQDYKVYITNLSAFTDWLLKLWSYVPLITKKKLLL